LCFVAENRSAVSSLNRKESGYNFNSAQEATIWQSKEPVRPDQQQGLQKHSGGKPTKQFFLVPLNDVTENKMQENYTAISEAVNGALVMYGYTELGTKKVGDGLSFKRGAYYNPLLFVLKPLRSEGKNP
jgi:hypothetical protein